MQFAFQRYWGALHKNALCARACCAVPCLECARSISFFTKFLAKVAAAAGRCCKASAQLLNDGTRVPHLPHHTSAVTTPDHKSPTNKSPRSWRRLLSTP